MDTGKGGASKGGKGGKGDVMEAMRKARLHAEEHTLPSTVEDQKPNEPEIDELAAGIKANEEEQAEATVG